MTMKQAPLQQNEVELINKVIDHIVSGQVFEYPEGRFELRDDVLIVNETIFGDGEEHSYYAYCFDGFVVYINSELSYSLTMPPSNEPIVLVGHYSKMDELSDSEKKKVLRYFVGEDAVLYENDVDGGISVGDIAVYYGATRKLSNAEEKVINCDRLKAIADED